MGPMPTYDYRNTRSIHTTFTQHLGFDQNI